MLYDAAHGIAFFTQGCCAWHSTVLAAGIAKPPVQVVRRTLLNVHTVHGIALGQTIAQVESIYGTTTSHAIGQHSQLRMLSYYHNYDRSSESLPLEQLIQANLRCVVQFWRSLPPKPQLI